MRIKKVQKVHYSTLGTFITFSNLMSMISNFMHCLRACPQPPVVVPRDQLDITLQEGSLAFQLHPDFEERIEDVLAVRAQQDDGDQLEEDPIDEELANLDSDALRVHTLQQR